MERTVIDEHALFDLDTAIESDRRLLAEKTLEGIAEDTLEIDLHGHGYIEGIPFGNMDGGVQQGVTGMPAVDGHIYLGPAQLEGKRIGIIQLDDGSQRRLRRPGGLDNLNILESEIFRRLRLPATGSQPDQHGQRDPPTAIPAGKYMHRCKIRRLVQFLNITYLSGKIPSGDYPRTDQSIQSHPVTR